MKLLHRAEDADPLVLIKVIDIAYGNDAFRWDSLVVGDDAGRNASLAKLLRGLLADAGKFGKALVGRRHRICVGVDHRLQHVVDLLIQRIGKLRVRDEVGGQPACHLIPQSRYAVIKALILFFGRHSGLLTIAALYSSRFRRSRDCDDTQSVPARFRVV